MVYVQPLRSDESPPERRLLQEHHTLPLSLSLSVSPLIAPQSLYRPTPPLLTVSFSGAGHVMLLKEPLPCPLYLMYYV